MNRRDRLKRIVRRLIPDSLMARLRLHQQSRGARVNVDVVAESPAEQRRWLRSTPDTYRVRGAPTLAADVPFELATETPALAQPSDGVVVVATPGHEAAAPQLAALAAGGPARVAVLGSTAGPRLAAGRRAEPEVAPLAIAAPGAAIAEAGALPSPPDLAPALLERLRAAGHSYTLVPAPPGPAPSHRSDPISGPVAAVLSLVPMHDVGGGSRPAQLGRALLGRGFHVTFVAGFPSYETSDTGLRYLHHRLEEQAARRFDPSRLVARSSGAPSRLVVAAAPHAELAEAAAHLAGAGFTLVYDLIDDWSAGSLGGDWYRNATEARLVTTAAAVTAGTVDLVARAGEFGAAATLLPNGVDVAVFSSGPGPEPADFPPGDGPVVGYHGSLWADWIDWDGIAAVADADPDTRVVLIGDHRGRRPVQRPNVHYLGLKPQLGLAPYVARFDAGMLPRIVSATTHAMSPLKVYEYLAAGVPVAAPPLRSLRGIAGVHTAPRLEDAAAAALAAPRPDPGPVRTAHSWDARVDALLEAAGIDPPPAAEPGPTAVLRPPVHHAKRDRRI